MFFTVEFGVRPKILLLLTIGARVNVDFCCVVGAAKQNNFSLSDFMTSCRHCVGRVAQSA
jgi:hypothetical protein